MVKIRHLTRSRMWPSDLPLVIGYFNVVHVMHVQLLTKYSNFNILTFKDFYSKKKNAVYSFEERITNLEKYKPDNIYVLDLNQYNMTAQEFVNEVLKKINPSHIVVGEDFIFGSDHKGVDFLKNYFDVDVIKYNKLISSTNIVKDIKSTNLEKANDYLDEPFYYVSKWLTGRKLGRTIGYRTINLQVKDNLIVPDGTYITVCELGNKKYQSITFIGTSQSTGSTTKTIEVHILNKKILHRSLYPTLVRNNVKLSFLKFLRKNRKFINSQKLINQITKDKAEAIKYFKENI